MYYINHHTNKICSALRLLAKHGMRHQSTMKPYRRIRSPNSSGSNGLAEVHAGGGARTTGPLLPDKRQPSGPLRVRAADATPNPHEIARSPFWPEYSTPERLFGPPRRLQGALLLDVCAAHVLEETTRPPDLSLVCYHPCRWCMDGKTPEPRELWQRMNRRRPRRSPSTLGLWISVRSTFWSRRASTQTARTSSARPSAPNSKRGQPRW